MQGKFDSATSGVPAVLASGSHGAGGIAAGSIGSIAVSAACQGNGIGVRATSDAGWAINAQAKSGIGILGASDSNVGVWGESQGGYNFGVVGKGINAGVAAFNSANDHAAYLASECCAAWFTGNVTVTGRLSKGGGGFRIDHPTEPKEKFLNHSFVESNEMRNLYEGSVITDQTGRARIELPVWVGLVNEAFCYQLTPIGAAAPELHVEQELEDGVFRIGGAPAGTKICWMVTGRRCDHWARANPMIVEEEKEGQDRGALLHPQLHDAKAEAIEHRRHGRGDLSPRNF